MIDPFSERRYLDEDRWVVGDDPRCGDIELGVIHYTAGASILGDVRYLEKVDKDHNISASYHAIVGDGKAIELLQVEHYRAWHAGRSSWPNISNVNGSSIGIAISNRGHSKTQTADHTVRAPMPVTGEPMWWEPYAPSDIVILANVCYYYEELLNKELTWVGHQDVSPARKQDPGPLFPWEKFHQRMTDLRSGKASIEEEGDAEPEPVLEIDEVIRDLSEAKDSASISFPTRDGRVLTERIEIALAWAVYMRATTM